MIETKTCIDPWIDLSTHRGIPGTRMPCTACSCDSVPGSVLESDWAIWIAACSSCVQTQGLFRHLIILSRACGHAPYCMIILITTENASLDFKYAACMAILRHFLQPINIALL